MWGWVFAEVVLQQWWFRTRSNKEKATECGTVGGVAELSEGRPSQEAQVL